MIKITLFPVAMNIHIIHLPFIPVRLLNLFIFEDSHLVAGGAVVRYACMCVYSCKLPIKTFRNHQENKKHTDSHLLHLMKKR